MLKSCKCFFLNFFSCSFLALSAFSMEDPYNNLSENALYFCDKDSNLIYIDQSTALKLFPDLELIIDYPEKNRPALLIKFMNKAVGYGLFAGADINEGTFVCEYSGEKSKNIENKESLYNCLFKSIDSSFFIDAEKKGGVGRFIQHAPASLEDYIFVDESDEKKLATANVAYSYNTSSSYPEFYAIKNIRKGELIALNYGDEYWYNFVDKNGFAFELFNKSGEIIPKNAYEFRKVHLALKSISDEEGFNAVHLDKKILTRKCMNNDKVYVGPLNDMCIESNLVLREINDGKYIIYLEETPYCKNCKKNSRSLKKCSRCKKAYYCNIQCQKNNWDKHKNHCKKL